jgi:hypothetical protein
MGFQGIQGVQGIQGLDGAYAGQGIQGAIGIQGIQGIQGPQGLDGAYAGQGIQGATGFQGIQGIQGPQCAQGTQGTIGYQGIQGIQGIQGPQGSQGSQGLQGRQGIQGIQGVQGVQGLQGLQGLLGLQGTQGIQGFQGTQGFQGLQGSQGLQGVQGTTPYEDCESVNINICSAVPNSFLSASFSPNLPILSGETVKIVSSIDPQYFVKGIVSNYNTTSGNITITVLDGNYPVECEVVLTEQKDMIFVVDNSGSITLDEMNQQKAFLNALVDNLEANITSGDVQIGISLFGTFGSLVIGLTSDVIAIRAAITSLTNGGGSTNLLEGVCYANNELVANGRIGVDKQLVLLTDGIQNTSDNTCSGVTANSTSFRSYVKDIKDAGTKVTLVVYGILDERKTVIDYYITGNYVNNPVPSNGIYFEASFEELDKLVQAVTLEIYGNEVIYSDWCLLYGYGDVGVSGTQGVQGIQGISIQGTIGSQGIQGIQGFRGNDGTSVVIQGSVPTSPDLGSIVNPAIGDGYIVENTGHL